MHLNEVQQAVQEAAETLRAADQSAQRMANLLVGRLRHCSPWTLKALKRELRDFNMTTREWEQRE